MKNFTFLTIFFLIIISIYASPSFGQNYFEDEKGEYLIIVHDVFYPQILPLAQWKYEKGLDVEIGKISQIGSTASQIKGFITDAYTSWEVPPEYVLLVGDTEYIPIGPSSTDNYYANMEGDFHGELFVGRFSCDTTDDCETLVAKTVGYEKNPTMTPNPDWFRSAVMIVRDDFDEDDPVYYADTFYGYDLMIENGYTVIDTFFHKNNDTNDDIENAVTEGRMLVNYRGQAVSNWWYPFSVNPYNMNNGFMLPIVMSATCGTGSFYDDSHICETWVRAGTSQAPQGAVAFFGTSTVGGYLTLRSRMDRCFFKAVFEDEKTILGQACLATKNEFMTYFPNNDGEYRGWNLLGDPELNLWTATPDSIFTQHSPLLPTGPFDFTINVSDSDNSPIENARVCISKDDEIHEIAFTDETGSLIFPISPLTTGEITLTITKKNCSPYTATIPVYNNISAVEGWVKNSETNIPQQYANISIPSTGQQIYSDENGFYRLYVIEEGFYTIHAQLFGFYDYVAEGIYITPNDTTDLDIFLQPKPSTTLEGYLLREDGNPISDGEVKPINATVNPVYADQTGYYIFPDIPADYNYQIQASHPDYINKIKFVEIGSDPGNILDFELVYLEKFETSDGDFLSENQWDWGIPTTTGGPDFSHSGEKVWGTNLTDFYNPYSNTSLITPHYLLQSGKDDYKLTFYHWYETNEGWDGGNVQISVDDGENWELIIPQEDYPDNSVVALTGQPGYTGDQLEWVLATFDLSDYIGQEIIFRFKFCSTNTQNKRGWFIDDFAVYGATPQTSFIKNKYESIDSPAVFKLQQNYPNPFNPQTVINYRIPIETKIELSIYNLHGQLIKNLIDRQQKAGRYTTTWDGTDNHHHPVSSGVYIYKLDWGTEEINKKMLLLK